MRDDRGGLLFISHAGSDTGAAEALRERILNAPSAREAGLGVWLDTKDLRAGDWQSQIEHALGRATAFAVLIGAGGVRNWVMPEVRAAIDRAVTDEVPFIPVALDPDLDPASLPIFLRQYQIIRDPLADETALGDLLTAACGTQDRQIIVAEDPYVGLRAMSEADQHLFFGRDEEIRTLLTQLRISPLVAVVADSGAGKSSLVRAGLTPAYRGGAILTDRHDPDRHWNVVTMRPGSDPELSLSRAVDQTAAELGLSGQDRARLRDGVIGLDPRRVGFALACDLPSETTETLLIIDQFEELITQVDEAARAAFLGLLLDLTQHGSGVRAVITIRSDYLNLVRNHQAFWRKISAVPAAMFRLRRISDAGVRDIVGRPLTLAGYDGATSATRAAAEREKDGLTKSILADISDRPGDLALVQIALAAIWVESARGTDSLVASYTRVGGIFGALAHGADRVLTRLSPNEVENLFSVLVRLVRPGETAGATRRTAELSEFDNDKRALVQKLASGSGGRLVLIDAETVEIAHEALISQWSWLQSALQPELSRSRALHKLIAAAKIWTLNEVPSSRATGIGASEDTLPVSGFTRLLLGGEKLGTAAMGRDMALARGHDLALFRELAAERPNWLSRSEADFIGASVARADAETTRRLRLFSLLDRGFIAALVLGIVSLLFALGAGFGFFQAQQAAQTARIANLEALLAQAESANEYDEHMRGAALSIAALARPLDVQQRGRAERALHRASLHLGTVRRVELTGKTFAAHDPTAPGRVQIASDRTGLGLWDPRDGGRVTWTRERTEGGITALAPIGDGRVILGTSAGAFLITTPATGEVVEVASGTGPAIVDLAISPDREMLAVASLASPVRLYRLDPPRRLDRDLPEGRAVTFTRDGASVFIGGRTGSLTLVDATSGEVGLEIEAAHGAPLTGLARASEAGLLSSIAADGSFALWDVLPSGEPVSRRTGLPHPRTVAMSPDGRLAALGGLDGTVTLLNAGTGVILETLRDTDAAVMSAEFSPDGSGLLIGTRRGALLRELFDAGSAGRIEAICAILPAEILDDVQKQSETPVCRDTSGSPPDDG